MIPPDSERKLELQRRRRLAAYPRRGKAVFTDANEHNPLVLQDCPACGGTGKRDRCYEDPSGAQVCALEECADCGGSGVTGEVEPYFSAEQDQQQAVAEATPNAEGWLRCPGCGVSFSTRDPHRWSGYRHLRCGQRIRVAEGEA